MEKCLLQVFFKRLAEVMIKVFISDRVQRLSPDQHLP